MKPIIVAILLAVVTATARAQVSNSLQACIDTALANNPEIAASQRKWEAARQKIPQARALDDPMIGVIVDRVETKRFDTFDENEWMISQTVDRKSTRLNSSHRCISYAVFCLKKKKIT